MSLATRLHAFESPRPVLHPISSPEGERMSKTRTLVIRGTHLIAVFALMGLLAQAQGVIPGRYIVTFETTVSDPAAAGQQLRQAHGFQIRSAYRYALQGMLIE